MTLDISDILKDWKYLPGQVTVRKIRGADGREKIQLRLDLGLLQMEATGRPDGARPHGYESLLDYYDHQLEQYRRDHDTDDGFGLDADACDQLRAEGVMYYHRYLAQFVLEEFDAVERDTARNIQLLDLMTKYAEDEADRQSMEQYRPYIIMMHTRARAQIVLRDGRPRDALRIVREGAERIREFLRRYGQEEVIPRSGEIAVLNAFAKEIKDKIPVDPLLKVKRELREAIREERYEEAARLRDELRKLAASARAEPRNKRES